MNKLTFEQIGEILESQLFADYDHGPEQWFYEDVYSSADEIEEEGEFKEVFRTLGSFELVAEYGGEGKGDEYYKVFHFKDHDVYIKFDGWHQSYNGAEYDSMFEVKPEQVTITVYNPV